MGCGDEGLLLPDYLNIEADGGSSQSTFGSSTADVITKITAVMVGVFMVGSLGLSILESKKGVSVKDSLEKTEKAPTGVIESSPEKKKEDKN